jgi:hypothetical protein
MKSIDHRRTGRLTLGGTGCVGSCSTPTKTRLIGLYQLHLDTPNGANTNHRLDLDFNAKSKSRRVEHQVIQLLNFAFFPAW